MASIAAVAAVAGTTAAAAYLNARLHIGKDLSSLYRLKQAEKRVQKLFQQQRASGFYAFEDSCNAYPDILAIWSREGCYSRRETYQRVCQYGNYFLSLGVKPNESVAVYHMNSPEFMFIWIGLWSIGCYPALINYNLAADPLVHCVKIGNAKVLLVDQDKDLQKRIQDSYERLQNEAGVRIITLNDDLKTKIAAGDASRPPDTLRAVVNHPQIPVGLIYTSGTTGLPKAFGFETWRVQAGCKVGREVWGMKPGKDVFYDCMPFYHGTGGVLAFTRMMDGVTLAIGKKFSTTGFWKDIRDSKATLFGYVGEAARYLLAAPPSPMDREHNVRMVYGNGMRPEVWEKFQERFGIPEVGEFFSSTEGMFAIQVYTKSSFGTGTVGHHGIIYRALLYNRFVPVAIDANTGDVWRDPATGFAKRNRYSEGGEIIVRMAGREDWPGYFQASDASDKKIIRNVFKAGDIFYRTGDALRRDHDGFWHFMDRLGDTFRWKGENVSTAEVSVILGRHPDIHEANVYGVVLPNHDGRAGCAAVELSSATNNNPGWKDLANFARANLPKYAVPIFIRVVRSASGSMGTHNYKQNKLIYRDEGVDPALRGTKVLGGEADEIYWLHPRSESYVPLSQKTWNDIVAGHEKL